MIMDSISKMLYNRRNYGIVKTVKDIIEHKTETLGIFGRYN